MTRYSVEDLFAPPERTAATISPDGTRIAYLAPWRNRLNVWIEDLDGGAEPRCVTADETRTVQRFEWAGPDRVLYLQDTGGDENNHVFRVDLASGAIDDLTPFDGARVLGIEQPRDRPGTAEVQLNARDHALFDLYEIDVASGELTMLAENPGHAGWMRGPGDELFVSSATEAGDTVLSRWNDGDPQPVTTFLGDDFPVGISPFELTPDRTAIWAPSYRGTDRTHLVRIDLATGEETLVDSHPTLDIDTRSLVFPALPSALIQDRRTGALLGVRYLGERQVIHALDPDFADVLKNLEGLSDGDLARISSDESGRRWVVSFTHDRDPAVTWFYDHATGERRLLFRPFPHLDPEALAPMRPVTITARDGLTLPSFLTLPVGVEPRGLPLVLAVHGGPWTRDAWEYATGVQLLANRGYAVLQVNFRGSVGFGRAHTRAGIGELAGAMHTDLLDGVDWAVEQGYADPDRVAIVGASYGGYAALVGATFTPDRFAAVVDVVGISDLENFMRTQPDFVRPYLAPNWYRYVGDPADPEQLADMRARSPITRVDRITAPLFVAQGANDARVVKAESDRIVESLRARGVDVDYMVRDDEGHGFVNPENVIALWERIDAFLAEHLA
ncbi:S9 family peptidase [Pseudonocardia endophytica]|uniref:Dipeptidyl aminopeptidase/acylaminoacyl peptidase n=1 Tax=Pseudonocardia endophytica TaxID=401976 RepID=A0A4R1I0X0_PSEEN|nr:S9 family peptidase [Pseudonocardia endophytica]TCK27551.1 dipeptidyl aminopeptidase/acylaminoacyl peptidase [Pseudonocardia endophytica]